MSKSVEKVKDINKKVTKKAIIKQNKKNLKKIIKITCKGSKRVVYQYLYLRKVRQVRSQKEKSCKIKLTTKSKFDILLMHWSKDRANDL